MRRLLFVCHYLHHVVGGAEIIGHKVVAGLRAAGWGVDTVVLPGPSPAPADGVLEWRLPFGLRASSLRGKQVAIYAGGLGIDAAATRQILRLAAGRRYDAVVSHDTVSVGVAHRLSRALGLPLVAFVYEPLPRLNPGAGGPAGLVLGGLTAISNRIIRAGLLHACGRIAASRDTARRLDAFAPGAGTRVVYNSIPGATRVAGRGEGLLFVGRLSREKGFDLLAEAYGASRVRPPLSIAGLDGPLAGLAHQLAATHAEVRLLEPVPPSQMEGVYARHAVVVAPSMWPDPLPGAVLEARAFGRALLVTDQGGIPEIVEGYRPAVMVSAQTPRAEIVRALALAIDTLGSWAAVPADPEAEAAFRARHSPERQREGVLGVLDEALRAAAERGRRVP